MDFNYESVNKFLRKLAKIRCQLDVAKNIVFRLSL